MSVSIVIGYKLIDEPDWRVIEIPPEDYFDLDTDEEAERSIQGLEEPDWLMVITTKIQERPPVWEILRLQREENSPVFAFHSFITENEDGSETERIVYPDS